MPKKIKDPVEGTKGELNPPSNLGEVSKEEPQDEELQLVPTSSVVEREMLSEIHDDRIYVQNSAVGVVRSEENASMERCFSGAVVAASDIKVEAGGAAAIVAGGDINIHNGGGKVLVIGGDLAVKNGAGQVLIAGGNVQAQNSFLGVVVSPSVSLGEGSRVLMDTPRAVAFGAAFGLIFALINLFMKTKKVNPKNG